MERDICKNWTQWLMETRFAFLSQEQKQQTKAWLELVRDNVLRRANVQKGETVIDVGTGTGLLAFKVLEQLNGTGKIIFSDKFKDCLDSCEEFLKSNEIFTGYEMLQSPAEHIDLPDNSVDKALMRSVLVHIVDKQPAIDEMYRILKKGGHYCCFEPIISSNTRYSELVNPKNITRYEEFKIAEEKFMTNPEDSLCNFDDKTLLKNIEKAGFIDGSIDIDVIPSTYIVDPNMVDKWFTTPPSPDQPSTKQRYMKYFDEATVDNFILELKNDLGGREITVCTNAVYIDVIK